MDFLSNLFGLNESKAASASASLSNGTLAAKLNTPAPQLGGRRRTAKHQRNTKRRTHKRK